MRARPNRAFQLIRRTRGLIQGQVADAAAELVERATGRQCGIEFGNRTAEYLSEDLWGTA